MPRSREGDTIDALVQTVKFFRLQAPSAVVFAPKEAPAMDGVVVAAAAAATAKAGVVFR